MATERASPSDGELIERTAAGDQEAFELLYRRFARRVLGLALRRLGDRSSAEDAVGEVFAAIRRSAGSYDAGDGPGELWLYAVARAALGGGRDDAGAEAAWRTHGALERLPTSERLLIELTYWGGLTQAEAAEFLHVPLGTVEARARDALGRLGQELPRAHELLLEVGPPPELPAQLGAPSELDASAPLLPRRRRGALALVAAALALALFGAGYLAGGRGSGASPTETIRLAGTGEGAGAFASVALLPEDAAGNRPLELRVRGLPSTGSYELWLARGGRLTKRCGGFAVHEGVTEVRLSVPFRVRGLDWVVTRAGSTQALLTT